MDFYSLKQKSTVKHVDLLRTNYPDSEPTRLCCFSFIMCALRRSNKCLFYSSGFNWARTHDLPNSRQCCSVVFKECWNKNMYRWLWWIKRLKWHLYPTKWSQHLFLKHWMAVYIDVGSYPHTSFWKHLFFQFLWKNRKHSTFLH